MYHKRDFRDASNGLTVGELIAYLQRCPSNARILVNGDDQVYLHADRIVNEYVDNVNISTMPMKDLYTDEREIPLETDEPEVMFHMTALLNSDRMPPATESDIKKMFVLSFPTEAEAMKAGEQIHNQLVGNPDYIGYEITRENGTVGTTCPIVLNVDAQDQDGNCLVVLIVGAEAKTNPTIHLDL